MIQNGQKFIETNREGIGRILDTFGGRLAKELELNSTIVYLRRHMSEQEFDDNEALQGRVKALKPKCSRGYIERAIREVRDFLAG